MIRKIPWQSLVLPYLAGVCVYLTIATPYFGILGLVCSVYAGKRMRDLSDKDTANERNHLNTAQCFALLSVIVSGFVFYAMYGMVFEFTEAQSE